MMWDPEWNVILEKATGRVLKTRYLGVGCGLLLVKNVEASEPLEWMKRVEKGRFRQVIHRVQLWKTGSEGASLWSIFINGKATFLSHIKWSSSGKRQGSVLTHQLSWICEVLFHHALCGWNLHGFSSCLLVLSIAVCYVHMSLHPPPRTFKHSLAHASFIKHLLYFFYGLDSVLFLGDEKQIRNCPFPNKAPTWWRKPHRKQEHTSSVRPQE